MKTYNKSITLTEALTLIAAQIHADAQELIAYAAEDNLGGYHWNPALATFPMGSCFGVEGQMLYALVRHLKPDTVVEIGGWAGCSGSHLALAVLRNGKGKVISVDNEVGGMAHGNAMLPELRQFCTLVRANGQDWLAEQPDGSLGLIFEDADHSTPLVALLSSLALRKLQPGGYLVNHDAMHDKAILGGGQIVSSDVADAVQLGLRQAGAYFSGYLVEPSDCGIALTVAPGVKKPISVTPIASDHLAALSIGNANIESVSQPPAPKKTRTRKAKAQ